MEFAGTTPKVQVAGSRSPRSPGHESQQFEHPSSPGDSLIFLFNRLGCLFLAYEQPGSTIFLSVYGVHAASYQ